MTSHEFSCDVMRQFGKKSHDVSGQCPILSHDVAGQRPILSHDVSGQRPILSHDVSRRSPHTVAGRPVLVSLDFSRQFGTLFLRRPVTFTESCRRTSHFSHTSTPLRPPPYASSPRLAIGSRGVARLRRTAHLASCVLAVLLHDTKEQQSRGERERMGKLTLLEHSIRKRSSQVR